MSHFAFQFPSFALEGGIGGSTLEVKTLSDNLMRTRQITAEVLVRHTGHSMEEVLAMTAHDAYFEAAEAVAWGLADRIVEKL